MSAGDVAQDIGAIVSVGIFMMTSGVLVLSRKPWMRKRLNGYATLLRYSMWGLWIFALLRLYSSTSFLWASTLNENAPVVLEVTRFIVLALGTILFAIVGAIALYLWRIWERRKEGP